MTDDREAQGDAEATDASAEESLSTALGAAAAKNTGLGALAGEQAPSGDALLRAMGGVRGICEAVLPGLAFIVLYTALMTPLPDTAVPIALGASVLIALVFTVWRVARKENVTQAVAGLIGVGASAILAIATNRPVNNFALGLGIDALYGLAFLVSVLVRWPIIGIAVGYLYGEGVAWRKHKATYRVAVVSTLLWLALFVARLAVQVPLFLAGNTAALAITHLIMGVPLYVPVLLVTWLLVRDVYARKNGAQS
ncbi:DUF3159 domain-containing protein [Gryllotalpicola protaetiae]|uniref:DUF3159 domain-containing protein n=1 Tax=Gryllotalpicola protaetiae TaxID=2419771 RepID=A0A387BSF4_9MICO|nr:DUF3159 domain-containing protein [Gryllotalpicola protaetiae]AYG05004.1 DUF3159 domain-containing protein [Gryllotalpicola protaetiae]